MINHKITKSEKEVLRKLIYPENFEDILEETNKQYGEIRDDLITLLNFGFVEAFQKSGDTIAETKFYDEDNLHLFSYRATGKGLSEIS